MATVDPRIASLVAHMPEVTAAVRLERDKVAAIAQALFASHDNPGGHEIGTHNSGPDALIDIDGPAPLSMEYGHWQKTKHGRVHVEGLHIFGRAIAQAAR